MSDFNIKWTMKLIRSKVFDEAIAEKWIQEGLALPVDPLYDEIVQHRNPGFRSGAAYGPDRLKHILDRGCLEYVRTLNYVFHSVLIISVYQRASCQGQVL
jgi:hypothetical protein